MKRSLACAAYAAASLGLHAWLLSASPTTAAERRRVEPPLFVQLAVPEPPSPAPPPSEPPPEPKVERPLPRVPAQTAKPPAVTETTPAEATPPPELTGTTLTSDTDATWTAPAGSGNERAGLLQTGAVGAFAQPTAEAKITTPTATSRVLVRPEPTPLAQLSRKPSPPPLADVLERVYPVAARRLGRSGDAAVRARVESNGLLSEAQIKSESATGFGAACRQALLGSRWTGPLDREGRPVATWVTYRCKFRSE